ncbi:MAG TPA: AGE family epimerase/isomerase [Caulobacteraceae bacterium]|jgi:mannose-6-phosphate isomerase
MTSPAIASAATHHDAKSAARRGQQRLLDWLLHKAYPLWSTQGVDRIRGGFHERLDADGTPLDEARRARVQPRQIYAFAHGAGLGWDGDASAITRQGLDYFRQAYRRPDGLYRTLVTPDGAPLDESVLLYDQAFALLGMASACRLPRHAPELEYEALALVEALHRQLGRPGFGFDSGLPGRLPLLSNPHMHLFEACLEWADLSPVPVWRGLADELGALALTRFIDPVSSALRETFDETWAPASGLAGRIVEPGHQFEWAWLLMRWRPTGDPIARRVALRLIDIGEQFGVRCGVAIDALLDDFTIHQATARLWPQTERLKAAALAASLTDEVRYWEMAAAAATGLRRYLKTPTPGLWHDRLTPDGVFAPSPAPASNFYHIVASILALTKAVQADTAS